MPFGSKRAALELVAMRLALLAAASFCGTGTLVAGETAPGHFRPLRDVVFPRTPAELARGRYLAEGVLQCFICHSERDWTVDGAPPRAES